MWNYLKEVRGEMKHVSWPSRRQTIIYTLVVIGVSLATAVYLGISDYLLSFLLKGVI